MSLPLLIVIGIAIGVMGWLGGCQYAQQDQKIAETQFVERVKVVKEIERVEVPKFITRIVEREKAAETLITEAKNDSPNPVVCDLSPDRVRRIRLSATGSPE